MSDALNMPQILVVCTGNVCRSPITERMLSQGLAERGAAGRVQVHSAGTGALVGETMTPQTQRLLVGRGGNPEGFVSRAVVREMVADADLVLALTRRHRAAVVTLHPRANRYTFTLREAERLLGLVDQVPGADVAERVRALPAAIAAKRGLTPVDDPALDDVVDPYRREDAVYEQMLREIGPAVDALLGAVAPRR